ncbi:hypothetical protein [Sulfurospirillum barnesii]|uniref:Uncharacterized protein n=1 Tax=Sulfurospirillum barnesii (strain ATCC 700032 / DSM 10660 / SES-3) TaxID=760154 RepID=I3XWM7_SULBS|nr:hypothetical protein [Sulfurospirillum barnesii]AFL68351.1 hypothetical protein Sulba_1053 [Sulfurospirillum barnesii SES-3]
MNDKEMLYYHTKQTQLNEWKAGMTQIRTQALAARVHLQVALIKHVKLLEVQLEEGKTCLTQLMNTTGSGFESAKKTFEVAWESIIKSLEDTTAKFKAIV